MHREEHILTRLSKGNSPFVRTLCFTLIATFSIQANAVTLSKLKGMKGFQAVALAVAMVNKSMRDAAQNPMDQWRRQNVAHTVGLLPVAITALAQDFKSGQLHDGDLKFVQGVLGGFVDVNAASTYEKFAKNPTAANIPALGSNFPKEFIDRAETQSLKPGNRGAATIAYNEGNGKNDSVVFSNTDLQSQVTNLSAVSLSDLNKVKNTPVSSGTSGNNNTAAGNKPAASSTASIGYNEDARPSGLAGKAAKDSKSAAAFSAEDFDRVVAREVSSVESQLGLSAGRTPSTIITKSSVEKETLSDDFFQEAQKGKKTQTKGAHREVSPANYRITVKPKYWSVVPVMQILSHVLERKAMADDAPAPNKPQTNTDAPAPDDSGCKNGQCGGGGSGGGGGGGSGAGASEVLFGLAALMAAAAPMVAAAMQADADKEIAKTNADAQIQMTQMTAENSKFLADSQARMAEQQSVIAQQINKTNNDEQTKRLQMQLAEIEASRLQAAQAQKEDRAQLKEFNDEKIALAKKQAEESLILAQKTFDAQLTQAGLSSGFSNVNKGATGGLTVDPVANTYASTNSATANRLSNSTNSSLLGPSLGASNPSAAAGGTAMGFTSQKQASQTTQRGFASNRLLASVKGSSAEEEEVIIDPKTGQKVIKKKPSSQSTKVASFSAPSASRGVTSRGVSVEASGVSTKSLGSSRESMQKISDPAVATPKTDLANFQASTATPPGFAQWKSSSPATTAQAPTLGSSNHGGAYNAPSVTSPSPRSVRGIYGIE